MKTNPNLLKDTETEKRCERETRTKKQKVRERAQLGEIGEWDFVGDRLSPAVSSEP